jgi:hypothetical protein
MKHSPTFSLQWLIIPFLFLIFSTFVSATRYNIPRLSPFGGTILQDPETLSASANVQMTSKHFTLIKHSITSTTGLKATPLFSKDILSTPRTGVVQIVAPQFLLI